MKNKLFNLVAAAAISFFFSGGACAAVDLAVLPNSARILETYSSVLVGVVQLPSAARAFGSTAPSAVTKSPFNIAYRPQPLTLTNFPPESADGMIFNGRSQSEFSFSLTTLHLGLYADKPTGAVVVADASQKSKHPAQTVQQPESYTMMLAGLGMMAAIVRRRHKVSATQVL